MTDYCGEGRGELVRRERMIQYKVSTALVADLWLCYKPKSPVICHTVNFPSSATA